MSENRSRLQIEAARYNLTTARLEAAGSQLMLIHEPAEPRDYWMEWPTPDEEMLDGYHKDSILPWVKVIFYGLLQTRQFGKLKREFEAHNPDIIVSDNNVNLIADIYAA